MPKEPVEVLKEQFAATNERDFARAMTYYADDVVLVVEEGFLNTGTFEGKEAVGEWYGDWFRAFGTDYRFEIDEVRELEPGLVFMTATYGGSGRASGATGTDRRAYLIASRGKITRTSSSSRTGPRCLVPEWSEGKPTRLPVSIPGA